VCEICGHVPCVPLCPRRAERLHCAVCGGTVAAEDDALVREGQYICSLCMENLSVEGLLTLTARRGVRSFLRHELGFLPRV